MALGTRREPDLPSIWQVFAVLSATMLGFGGSLLYSQHVASRLDEEAESIAEDASPAIEHLSVASAQILRLQLAAGYAVQRARQGAALDRTPIDEPMSRLRRELDQYLTLPFFPYERELYDEVDRSVRDLEDQVSALAAQLSRGDVDGAAATLRGRVSPAAARADAALDRLVRFNAEQQHRLGEDIPRLRARAARTANVLAAATAALGMVLMWLVVRAISRYARLITGQKRLIEAHARQLGAFSSRLEALIVSTVRIARAITATGSLRDTFQTIADEARLAVDAAYCGVGCGTDPERPFDPWVFSGMPASVAEALGRPPRPVGLLGAVVQEGHRIRVDRAAGHPAFHGLPAHHPPLGSFLGVPIVREGRNVANLFLARKEGQPAFDADDEHMAELLAAYVEVAIENAHLYNQSVEATRARDDLLATVSHDLRNPLNTIRMAVGLLRKTGEGKTAELAARIDRASERMIRLIADLLQASRIEAGALAAVQRPEDAASLVSAAVEMLGPLAAAKSIPLSAEAPPRSVAVLCERDLVMRVFSNLIGNAIKFSPEGAPIAVAAEERAGDVRFSVSDRGAGIPAEHLAHVFERYWQVEGGDRRGSGLGLYIAKGIVEAHRGRIWITSAVGEGTTVHFTLPLARAPADADPASTSRP